jgi:diguanylate cyclase (GGDEF)-like protein/PAS domain S-box-containing protein
VSDSDRERYRALVERSADVIFVHDGTGTITYANQTAGSKVGTPPSALVGQNALDLIHPDDRTRALQALTRTVAAGPGEQEPFFCRVRRADGHWLPVELVGTNLIDDETVRGVVVTVRDISDRDRVDRLLAETEASYRRIVETAEEGVWSFDVRQKTTFVNRRMAEMLGVTPEDMVGTSVFDFMDDEERIKARQILKESADDPVAQRHELRFKHRDGRDVWTRCSGAPAWRVDGSFDGVVSLVTDITEQRAVEERLRYNEARLTTLFEVSSDIMAVLEPDGNWHASPAGTRILGYPMGIELEGGVLSLVHPDDMDVATNSIAEVLTGTRGKHEPVRIRLRHIDGRYLWFDCTAENQIDNPTVSGLIIIARDVTEQKTAEDAQAESEARFRAAFERSPLGIALITLEGHIMDANAAFSEMAGRTEEELIGVNLELLIHPDDRARVIEEGAARLLGASDTPLSRARLLHGDGRVVWIMSDLSLVTSPDGTPEYTIVLIADVTKQKELEAQLRDQAFLDPLTRLGNRARLRELLDAAWSRRSESGRLALLFVDLDRFKQVNDTWGHEVGDELLILVALRLNGSVRGGDAVSRFVGDEFVVVCEDVDGPDEARQIASRIRQSLELTYRLSSGEAKVAACVGIAIDDGHHSVDDLLRDADIAAYRAKELGRNRVHLADPFADEQARYPSQSTARSSR